LATNWSDYIQIDRTWVDKQLKNHFSDISDKLTIRLYTVKVSGTTIIPNGLADELYFMLPDYVYSPDKIEELGKRKAYLTANKFFGRKDPQTDGKYGELLLFALVESVLGCKMVGHKIASLSNFRDQVKGGDGLFLGNYALSDGRLTPAYLIGESKIMGNYSGALTDAFKSIDRFHNASSDEFLTSEFIVAKGNLVFNNEDDLDELYDRLTPSTNKFKEQVLVHPVLIMYNSDLVKNCETAGGLTPSDLEELLFNAISKTKEKIVKSINNKLVTKPNLKTIFLDFFLIPFNDVDKFRNLMYYLIHAEHYTK